MVRSGSYLAGPIIFWSNRPFCIGYVRRDVVDIPLFDHEIFAVNGKDRLPFEAGADLLMGVDVDRKPSFWRPSGHEGSHILTVYHNFYLDTLVERPALNLIGIDNKCHLLNLLM